MIKEFREEGRREPKEKVEVGSSTAYQLG